MDLNKSKIKLRLEIEKNYYRMIFNCNKINQLNEIKKINIKIIKPKGFKIWKVTSIHKLRII